MTTIRNGYICTNKSRRGDGRGAGRWTKKDNYKSWFRGSNTSAEYVAQYISLGRLTIPKEYHNKRLRFKVEVINLKNDLEAKK